jgi:hypothetical protein
MTKRTVGNKAVPPSFSMEATKRSNQIVIKLSGVISIVEYNCEIAVLKTHGGSIRVTGSKISVMSLDNNYVEILGRVEGIGFDYSKT